MLRFILIIALTTGSLFSFGQHNSTEPSLEEIANAQTEEMTEKLDLNEEQIEQVAALNLKVVQKLDAVEKNESLDGVKKKEFVQGNMADRRRVLSTILTDEQLAEYDKMMTVRKERKEIKRDLPVEKAQPVEETDEQ